MDYKKMTGYLTGDEQAALETLERSGWEIFIGSKIDDTHLKDGGRRRTFRKEGRYNLCVTCRRVDDPHRRALATNLSTERVFLAEEAEAQLQEAITGAEAKNEDLKKALQEAEGKLAAVNKELADVVKAADTGKGGKEPETKKADPKKKKSAKKSG